MVPAAERLAALLGVVGEELLLLRTAAWFHDIGFIERRTGHEECSTRIVAEVLPEFGYCSEQTSTIGLLIMATKLPQSPRSPLACLMADADLDALGRGDFLTTSQRLRDELAATGNPMSDAEWYQTQIDFLGEHEYWTAAAKQLRGPQKRRNMLLLDELLAACRIEER